MQLIITIIGSQQTNYLSRLLSKLSECSCHVVELRSQRIKDSVVAYLLVEGHWNQIAKFEALIDQLQKKLDLKIETQRPDKIEHTTPFISYSIETISTEHDDTIQCISTFLIEHGIIIEEITASCFLGAYLTNAVFTTRFIILVPIELRIFSLREDFFDFCDQMNIDAILEPIKR